MFHIFYCCKSTAWFSVSGTAAANGLQQLFLKVAKALDK